MSSAGDVNSDGFDDLLIGARAADPNGDDSGQSYVVFGSSTFDLAQYGASYPDLIVLQVAESSRKSALS